MVYISLESVFDCSGQCLHYKVTTILKNISNNIFYKNILNNELVDSEGDLSAPHHLPLQSAAVDPGHQSVSSVPHVLLGVHLGELDLGELLILVSRGSDHVSVIEDSHHGNRSEAGLCQSLRPWTLSTNQRLD